MPGLGEAMLLGLGGGIGFMYAVFEYRGHHPMVTVVAQAHPEPIVPAALARAGVGHEIRQTGSARVAERNLREVLGSGRAAICRIGRFALPWRPGPAFPDPLEVAVTGIDGGEVTVEDACAEPDRLPAGEFMAAWSSLRKGRHHLVAVTGPATADPVRAVRGAVEETVARLTGPALGTGFDVNFGLSGMDRLARQLGDAKGRTGWARRFADPEAFFTAMTRLHACLENEYTAPGATRPLYADFLDEAAGLLGGTACGRAAGLYREAGRLWSQVASRAVEPFPRHRALVRERAELLHTRGSRAADRLRELAGETAYEMPLDEEGRADLLAELAGLVAQAVQVEEEAVRALRQV
ncbi:DUF4872 domain-containing protein [Planomonospora corallina]|uniref:DUF4872 domain-containing protein n=1 Tax=Planomonospora corallina TaxID=1806052 RepID=A0ABV8IGA6_9ACTN